MSLSWSLPYVWSIRPNQKETRKAVWTDKIKWAGETSFTFDKGFSQHPSVSLRRGHWPNITFHQSYLNDGQIFSNKGFIALTPWNLPRRTEWWKGTKWQKHIVRKRRKQETESALPVLDTQHLDWNKPVCWVPVRFEPQGEENYTITITNDQSVTHPAHWNFTHTVHVQARPSTTTAQTQESPGSRQSKKQKPLRTSRGSEASSIQGVGADWRSGPESCQALIMRWAGGDKQRQDGFFRTMKKSQSAGHREHAEEKWLRRRARRTQAKWNKKRNRILQRSLRLMMLGRTTNNNALADVWAV